MSYLLIMIIKYLQHCWTIFLRHVCQCGFFWSHHKELRMYGAITNSAVYVTVTVTFSCCLAHMAVTRNFHVGLTLVHLRNCALVLFHFFSQLIFSFWFFSFSLSPVGVPAPHWYPWDGSWLHSTYMYKSNSWPFYLN